jgi:hypothetical protein
MGPQGGQPDDFFSGLRISSRAFVRAAKEASLAVCFGALFVGFVVVLTKDAKLAWQGLGALQVSAFTLGAVLGREGDLALANRKKLQEVKLKRQLHALERDGHHETVALLKQEIHRLEAHYSATARALDELARSQELARVERSKEAERELKEHLEQERDKALQEIDELKAMLTPDFAAEKISEIAMDLSHRRDGAEREIEVISKRVEDERRKHDLYVAQLAATKGEAGQLLPLLSDPRYRDAILCIIKAHREGDEKQAKNRLRELERELQAEGRT